MDALETHLHRQIEHSRDFFWHRLRWRAVRGELSGEQFMLTDVGAGIGLLGDLLVSAYPGAVYRFVEPLDSLVGELESRFGSDANANGADSYFDSQYVTLLDVLEHIEDDRAFLADLLAKTAPGATVMLTVPALQGLWSQWDVSLGHFRRYDKRIMRELLEPLPIRVREISYLFPELLAPALVRRTAHSAGQVDRGCSTAEFPDLPPLLNDLLYGIGALTLRMRRRCPAGTSLFVVGNRA